MGRVRRAAARDDGGDGGVGYLRRQALVVTAFATGVLLVCDAWFDVMTAHGDDQTWSVVRRWSSSCRWQRS